MVWIGMEIWESSHYLEAPTFSGKLPEPQRIALSQIKFQYFFDQQQSSIDYQAESTNDLGKMNMTTTSNVELGTEYEKFVQSVYQALLVAEGADTIDVRQNINLKGNSGCEHQIDVYWEFKVAGQLYRTAIECKSFNTSVNVGRVRDFYGVLVDVPGLIGVFATKIGYQSGAKLFADHYGISLREVREPTDADWVGRLRKIHLNMNVVMPMITKFNLRPSRAFLDRLAPNEKSEITLNFSTDDPIIFDSENMPVVSYEGLRGSLPHQSKSATGQRHFAPFPEHTFRTNNEVIEIDGIDIEYDVYVDTSEDIIDGDALAKAIIKDVTSGELTFVDKNGRVKTPRY
jgi:hypothetical protein